MHPKLGVKSLVAKGIDLGWVLPWPSLVAWPSFCAFLAKFFEKEKLLSLRNLVGELSQVIQKEV